MSGKQSILFWLPLVAVVAAAVVVAPWTPDAFEVPKRVPWVVFAAVLALASGRCRSRAGAGVHIAGTALLGWMAARSLLAGPFWRIASPLAAWALPILVFLCAASVPWSPGSRRALVRTVVLLSVAEAIIMILQRFGFDPLFGTATAAMTYAPGRMVGTIGYQNQASEFLGVALCLVPLAWKRMSARLALSLPVVIAIAFSANRAAIAALAAVGAVAAVCGAVCAMNARHRAFRRSFAVAIAVVAMACGAAVAVPETRARFLEFADPDSSAALQSRLAMVRAALSLWRDHPCLGAGAGAYAYQYIDRLGAVLPARLEHNDLRSLAWAREAHCDPLQFAAEFGAAGLVVLGALICAALHALRGKPGFRPVASAIGFLSICSLFSFSWQTSLAAPTVGLVAGMTLSPSRSRREGPDLPGEQSLAAATVAAFALLVAVPVVSDATMDLGAPEEAYWDLASGDSPFCLRGRWLASAVGTAVENGDWRLAAELFPHAAGEYSSPGLIVSGALALEKTGRPGEAAETWNRLAKSGLNHNEALRGLSRAREAAGDRDGAAEAEGERFRLWPSGFSDAEVFRLVSLQLMSGRVADAGRIAGMFRRRAASLGASDVRWTPEWDNLRGAILLASGRREEARACFESALRRKPSLLSARRNLQACLQSQ